MVPGFTLTLRTVYTVCLCSRGRDFGVCGFRKPSPTTRPSCSRWWEGEAFVGKFHYQHTHCFAHSMSYPPLARTTAVLVTNRRPKRSDVIWGSVLVHPWAPGLFWGETEKTALCCNPKPPFLNKTTHSVALLAVHPTGCLERVVFFSLGGLSPYLLICCYGAAASSSNRAQTVGTRVHFGSESRSFPGNCDRRSVIGGSCSCLQVSHKSTPPRR